MFNKIRAKIYTTIVYYQFGKLVVNDLHVLYTQSALDKLACASVGRSSGKTWTITSLTQYYYGSSIIAQTNVLMLTKQIKAKYKYLNEIVGERIKEYINRIEMRKN